MGHRLAASACLAILCATVVPVTSANHPQIAHGDAIVFDHKSGNEWWVEVVLSGGASGSVQSVQAMDTGGPWVTLTKRSWGAWAASFHIEPGNQVKFRASWTGGDMVASCWFDHPSGVERCSSPPGFDAAFSKVSGNAYWAEVVVTANQPVVSVFLSIDCAAGKAMTHRADWGKWVLGTPIPNGAKVTFIANGDSGGEQSGGYLWPQATSTTGCGGPPPRFGADFRNVKGNEWWVEVQVMAREPVTNVEVRLGCSGPWNPLTLRSWGAWAASYHIFPGTHVDFRATAANGLTDLSDNAYVWPQATPTDGCDHPWPRDSSFAQLRFRVDETWHDETGQHERFADGLVSTRFTSAGGGFWDGTCEQRVATRAPDGTWSNVTEHHDWDAVPVFGEVPATVGGMADVQTVQDCRLLHLLDQPVVGRETRTFSIRTSSGDYAPIDAYHSHDTSNVHDADYWWDARHGLMLGWDEDFLGGEYSRHSSGWLLDTDAGFS